ncbi:MAG: hypothetical protein LBK69_01960, partial [Syntrophomonadaceae bacterium]|nr:hypothetical protein [Syntrophomonadaceae bacterium]
MTFHKFLCFFTIGLALFVSGCGGNDTSSEKEELHTYRQSGLLGTAVTISLYGEEAGALAQECFDAIEDIDRRMSASR